MAAVYVARDVKNMQVIGEVWQVDARLAIRRFFAVVFLPVQMMIAALFCVWLMRLMDQGREERKKMKVKVGFGTLLKKRIVLLVS